MKANELMIGDWVYSKYQKKNIQITPYDFFTHGNLLEPIPLTQEIFEKNGFHKEWDEDIILMVCGDIMVEIGNMYKIYKDGKMYLRRVIAPLYYVHELQHALRLCRIDKTIEI